MAVTTACIRWTRKKIRARFEARFTARRMAENYIEVYQSLLVPKEQRLRLVV
jgi:hypothetical protein